MKSIRRQVSEILGVLIGENEWDETFHELEKQGKISQRQIIDILLVVLKRLEQDEAK
jgi:hypothetical protein